MPDAPPVPIWARPALLLRRLHPALAASVRPDLAFLAKVDARLPMALPLLVVVLVAVFSGARLTIGQVYTESLVFLVLAAAIGIVAPVAGVLLVLLHAVVDLARTLIDPFAMSGSFGPLGTIAGRLISFYLLWLLVVEIALMARAIPWVVMAGNRPASLSSRRQVAIGSTVVAVGLMTWIWTQAAGILIRPVFTWSGLGSPSTIAISNLQVSGMILVVASAAVAGVISYLRLKQAEAERHGDIGFEEFQDFDLAEFQSESTEGAGLVGQLARHMLGVFLLGGLMSGVLDLVILGGVALASQPLAERILKTGALRKLLAGIPWLVRFVLGFGVTFVIGMVINSIRYEPLAGSEFFPLVITVALGLVIFQVMLTDPEEEDEEEEEVDAPSPAGPSTGSVVGAVIVGVAVGAILQLAFPGAVAADNCSGLFDCNSTISGAAATAAGAAAAAAGAGVAAERNRRLRRKKRRRRDDGEPELEMTIGEPVRVDEPELEMTIGEPVRVDEPGLEMTIGEPVRVDEPELEMTIGEPVRVDEPDTSPEPPAPEGPAGPDRLDSEGNPIPQPKPPSSEDR